MNANPLKIIIAGGNGFLGRTLAGYFQTAGNEIIILTRSPKADTRGIREVKWDACSVGPWAAELEGATAMINLVGRSVDCRYTQRNRKLILESRVLSTRAISHAIARCKTPPPVWLNASTATIYKHNFGPPWNESGEIGSTREAKDEFSIQVATAWEQALNEAQTPKTRKVAMRTAMVLGLGANSVFPVLRRLARLGLGGRMGSGKQFMSWVHETDFCRAVDWLMTHAQLCGPVNVCAPNPVTNAEMMKTVRDVCGISFGVPASKWMLEIGAFVVRTESELLVKIRRVAPGRLLESGFYFQHPLLREAVEDLDKRMRG